MSELVQSYGQLASIVTRMVELARARQWEQLPGLDTRCSALVDRLRTLEPPQSLHGEDRARVQQLVSSIRADQEELTALLRPQLLRLMRTLDELQHQQHVHRAYAPRPS